MTTIREYIKIGLIILLLLRVVLLVFMATSGILEYTAGIILFAQRVVDTFAWVALLVFFFQLVFEEEIEFKDQITNMKTASLFAMILCFVRAMVTLVYLVPLNISQANSWPLAHNIVEVIVWLLLSLFFFFFWRKKRKHESRMVVDGEEDVF